MPSEGGEPRTILASPEQESVLDWHPDGKSLLVQRRTIDAKERTLFWVGVDGEVRRTLYRQRDEKYLATNDQVAIFSPDGRSVLLTSDEDGWNHIYVIPLEGSTLAVNPLCEINARLTFGAVAHALIERVLPHLDIETEIVEFWTGRGEPQSSATVLPLVRPTGHSDTAAWLEWWCE